MIKLKYKISLAVALLVCILLISVSVVNAPWSTLETGYAITSNYHGVDVLLGNPVTVTAGTLDSNVVRITFRWHFPNESIAREFTVSSLLTSPYPPPNVPQEVIDYENSTTIWYAQDSMVPDVLGDWGVQAFFQDSEGKDRAGLEDVIKIKATSFNAVPEVPFGTLAILAAMFGAIAIFAVRKKRVLHLPIKRLLCI